MEATVIENCQSKEYKESTREFSKVRCETIELLTNKEFEKPLLKFFIKGKKRWR